MSDTRKLIDFAHDQNGSEFRDALYSAIHDKVTAHIDAKRAEIAQTLITQQEEEVEYEDDEEVEMQAEEDDYDKMLKKLMKTDGKRLMQKYSADVKKSKDLDSGKALKKHIKQNPDVLKTYSKDVKKDKKMYGEVEEDLDEAGSPFDKDYKSQVPTKPGEKAGFTSKKVSTGTVFSRVPPKVEPTKEK